MSGTARTREQIAQTYLEHLQELACEVSAATKAIAGNALPKLQESVSRQEMLCASLTAMAPRVGQAWYTSDPSSLSPDSVEMKAKILTATVTLRDLNMKYAALLKRSGKTIACLALLCKSQMGHFQEDRGIRLKQQTWSCEM